MKEIAHDAESSAFVSSSVAGRFAQSELKNTRMGSLRIAFFWPYHRRETGAAEIRVRIVVEVHGGVDQHMALLGNPKQRRITAAPACRWIKSGAKGRGHNHDVVLARVDTVGDCPIDRGVVMDVA